MKNNYWKIALIILVILNIGTISFLWITHTPRPPRSESADHVSENPLVRRLGFDEKQKQQLKKLQGEHFKTMRPIEEKMDQLRAQLFDAAPNPLDEVQLKNLLDQLGNLQRTADSLMFVHFHQISEICREDQKADFHQLLGRMVRRNGRGRNSRGGK